MNLSPLQREMSNIDETLQSMRPKKLPITPQTTATSRDLSTIIETYKRRFERVQEPRDLQTQISMLLTHYTKQLAGLSSELFSSVKDAAANKSRLMIYRIKAPNWKFTDHEVRLFLHGETIKRMTEWTQANFDYGVNVRALSAEEERVGKDLRLRVGAMEPLDLCLVKVLQQSQFDQTRAFEWFLQQWCKTLSQTLPNFVSENDRFASFLSAASAHLDTPQSKGSKTIAEALLEMQTPMSEQLDDILNHHLANLDDLCEQQKLQLEKNLVQPRMAYSGIRDTVCRNKKNAADLLKCTEITDQLWNLYTVENAKTWISERDKIIDYVVTLTEKDMYF